MTKVPLASKITRHSRYFAETANIWAFSATKCPEFFEIKLSLFRFRFGLVIQIQMGMYQNGRRLEYAGVAATASPIMNNGYAFINPFPFGRLKVSGGRDEINRPNRNRIKTPNGLVFMLCS